MTSLSARERRAQRQARKGNLVDMNLVSLIDVFTILIFFLLSSAAGVETLISPKTVKLPEARADQAPRDGVVLVVTRQAILAEGRRLAGVAEVLADGTDSSIPALQAELERLAARQAVRPENQGPTRLVTLLGDKDIPYRLLRKVMNSCALAGYGDVQFAVRHKEGA
jgi:biopolymer transport protein ExbD